MYTVHALNEYPNTEAISEKIIPHKKLILPYCNNLLHTPYMLKQIETFRAKGTLFFNYKTIHLLVYNTDFISHFSTKLIEVQLVTQCFPYGYEVYELYLLFMN